MSYSCIFYAVALSLVGLNHDLHRHSSRPNKLRPVSRLADRTDGIDVRRHRAVLA